MESIKSCSTAPATQQDRDIETAVAFIVARGGAAYIGIQRGYGIAPDFVLFQPVVTTLAVPLATFSNPDEAVNAIRARLALAGFDGGAQ
jgi:hypothetical protein